MLKALQAILKKPTTIVGIVTAIMFQIIFSVIWMTAYHGITDRAKDLKIAIVNEDREMGQKIVEGVTANLPFKTEIEDSMTTAQEKLNNRDVQMVLRLPADFSKQLQTPGQTAQVQYLLNESNPQLIKSIMQGVSANITANLNKQAIAAGAQAVLTQINPNLPADKAAPMAQGLSERVTSDVRSVNKVDGMENQMVPMMLVLASFVGSMIMAMNVQTSFTVMAVAEPQFSKWSKFGARVLLNVLASLIVALIGTSLVLALGGQTAQGFWAMWGFQTLFLMTFMFFAQTFLVLFGNAGMLFNILMLSAQLVSSGAMVPRELLNGFYYGISKYLPATYAVEGGMDILFGGPSASGSAVSLVWIMGVCIALSAAGVAIRRENAAASVGSPQTA
jgi:YhgE/Pip-like protein